MFTKYKYLWLLLCLLVLLSGLLRYSYERTAYLKYSRYLPNYALTKFPPKVIVYSSMTSEYLIDHARELHEDFGFDGFILTQLPSVGWPGEFQKLIPLTSVVSKGNAAARANDMKNFIKIGLEQGAFCAWDNDVAWKKDLNEIRNVSAWAKQTGFVGVVLDTEAYHGKIWHNGNPENNIPGIQKIIEKRGEQTVKAILSGFPEAEIVVLIEGHLFAYTKKIPNKYAYWINFFNGMLKAKPPQGIDLFCERMYKVTDQIKLKSYYKDIKGEIIADNVEDPKYWLENCSIAFGLWPLGREYDDKRANYSLEQFREQYNTAIQYCPKYIWIYAHGLSWWETKEADKYKFNLKEATLPRVKNIEAYKEVLRKSKDLNLKLFYSELKYNRKYSYLEYMLERIFKVL